MKLCLSNSNWSIGNSNEVVGVFATEVVILGNTLEFGDIENWLIPEFAEGELKFSTKLLSSTAGEENIEPNGWSRKSRFSVWTLSPVRIL